MLRDRGRDLLARGGVRVVGLHGGCLLARVGLAQLQGRDAGGEDEKPVGADVGGAGGVSGGGAVAVGWGVRGGGRTIGLWR